MNVIGIIGVSTAAGIINSISVVSKSVFGLLEYINLSKNASTQDLCIFMEKQDIAATIKLLHCIINESGFVTNKPILLALYNINDIITKIEAELLDIEKNIEYNKSLYLMSNIRGYDCLTNLKRMEINVSILDKRSKNLFRTMRVYLGGAAP